MIAAYWVGLATIPALGVIWLILAVSLRILGAATARIPGVVERITPDTDERARAAFGAIVYSARRSWWLGFGEVGVCLVIGQGGRNRGDAAERLRVVPKITLNPKYRKSGDDA